MTDKNLTRTIEDWEKKIESLWDRTLDKQKIVVWSDSKGRYLRNECSKNALDIESRIVWWYKGGARLGEELENLKQGHSLDRYNPDETTIFLWFGTCDLTRKVEGGCIELVSEDNQAVERITEKYKEATDYLKTRGFRPIILETPYYSIQFWNERKGHTDARKLDDQLKSQIDKLNENTLQINTESGVEAPRFNIDFRCVRSKKGKTKYFSNLRLLRDGIHPGQKLSKAWTKKLVYYAGLNKKQNATKKR